MQAMSACPEDDNSDAGSSYSYSYSYSCSQSETDVDMKETECSNTEKAESAESKKAEKAESESDVDLDQIDPENKDAILLARAIPPANVTFQLGGQECEGSDDERETPPPKTRKTKNGKKSLTQEENML